MNPRFARSTIGKKVLVALTGLVMFAFLVGHLLGNLLVFQGPEALNHYAEFLKSSPKLLWGTRVALLLSVGIHIVCTVQLTRLNRAARPVPYVRHEVVAANPPSRLMIWSGIFLGLYIPYHLLHFTVGYVHPHFLVADVYQNVVAGFSVWYVSAIYIAAMVALGTHLYHGIWSVFQTLGLNHPRYNSARRALAVFSSLVIAGGFILIPVAVLLELVH